MHCQTSPFAHIKTGNQAFREWKRKGRPPPQGHAPWAGMGVAFSDPPGLSGFGMGGTNRYFKLPESDPTVNPHPMATPQRRHSGQQGKKIGGGHHHCSQWHFLSEIAHFNEKWEVHKKFDVKVQLKTADSLTICRGLPKVYFFVHNYNAPPPKYGASPPNVNPPNVNPQI